LQPDYRYLREQGLFAVRIIAACALAFFATGAVAENLVMDDPSVQYTYSFETRGPLHFCDFATIMGKGPILIKLTAAFITDDTKPKDEDLTVGYIVEAFAAAVDENSQLKSKQVKVVSGRIISDIFNSDLMASKAVDKDLGATYTIPSEGSLALFMNLLTIRGAYSLAVEFENNSSLIINVKPTPEIFNPANKWNACSIAVMQHQRPQ
jgi:hypothetical protein